MSRHGLFAALAASLILAAGAVAAQEQPATPAPAAQAPAARINDAASAAKR
ncbi:MAG: tonB-system energizer ExbB, partial [Mesorhizobium sp.]